MRDVSTVIAIDRGLGRLSVRALLFSAILVVSAPHSAHAGVGTFVEGAQLKDIPRSASAEARDQKAFRLVFAPHFVVSGKRIVVMIRDRQSGTKEHPESGLFRMISIEVPAFKAHFASALDDPAVRFRYSHGSNTWALSSLGFTMTQAVGRVSLQRLDDSTIAVDLDVVVSLELINPPTSPPPISPNRCRATGRIHKAKLGELGPTLGAPFELQSWQEAIQFSAQLSVAKIELSCEMVAKQLP